VRVLLDTNVILDVAMRRPGLFEGSKRALEKCEVEAHEIHISWHTLSNLFYILRRDRGGEKTIEFLRHLLSICTVAPVGHAEALRAVDYALSDFEDALQLSAAESCRADVLLTRNKADFGNPSKIAVLAPEEFAPPTSADIQP
jgi:predicted nucleic acid-binding protein